MYRKSMLDEYQAVNRRGAVAGADAHGLIALMFDATVERIALARAHLGRGDVAAKARELHAAAQLVDGLRMSLDKTRGGEIAENLDRLYEWASTRLVEANAGNDARALAEVEKVIDELRAGWREIPASLRGNAAAAA